MGYITPFIRSNFKFLILFAVLFFSFSTMGCKAPDEGAGTIGPIKKWGVSVGDRVQSIPAIAANGTIYVGSSDQHLYALSSRGRRLWRYKSQGHALSATIAPNGMIVFNSGDGYLTALDSTGRRIWERHPRQKLVGCPPAISKDQTVFTSGDLILVTYKLKDGKPVKFAKNFPLIKTCPTIDKNDVLYFGDSKKLYAWGMDGKQKWAFELKQAFAGPAFDTQGNLYIGTQDARIISLTNQGKVRWSYQAPRLEGLTKKDIPPVFLKPVISPNGDVIAVRYNEGIYALNAKGKKRWVFRPEFGSFRGTPVVDKDGYIFAGSSGFHVYALTPNGKQHYQFRTERRVMFAGALSNDQKTFYIGSFDSHFYALHTRRQGPAPKKKIPAPVVRPLIRPARPAARPAPTAKPTIQTQTPKVAPKAAPKARPTSVPAPRPQASTKPRLKAPTPPPTTRPSDTRRPKPPAHRHDHHHHDHHHHDH